MRAPDSHVTRKRLLLTLGIAVVLVIVVILIALLIVKPLSQGESQTNTTSKQNDATSGVAVEAEAKTFAQQFMDAMNHGLATGDFSSANTMYAEDCAFCKKSTDWYASLYRDGGRLEGGYYVNPTLRAVKQPNGWVVVTVEGTLAAYKLVYPNGTTESRPDEPDKSTFTVKKNPDGKWLVIKWEDD